MNLILLSINFKTINLGRKRSLTPRDRLDYRGDRTSTSERSLSHGRDGSLTCMSSSRLRDPRTDDRMRRLTSPTDNMPRDRYRLVLFFTCRKK